jgi:hypothetical protein
MAEEKDILKRTDKVAILKKFFYSDALANKFLEIESIDSVINFDRVLYALGFSAEAMKIYKPKLVEWVNEDGTLTDKFKQEYSKLMDNRREKLRRFKAIKKDAPILDSIPTNEIFDIKNTFECIANNMNIKYYVPEDYTLDVVDFEHSHLQYARLICVSESLPIPFTFLYTNRCSKCDDEVRVLNETDKPRCSGCEMPMKRINDATKSMTVYISKVVYDGNQIDVISRVKLPMNQFDAAIIPLKNDNKYMFFILAVAVPEPKDVKLVWSGGDRLVELMRMIDVIHVERIGKCIRGLDHIKMSILLSRLNGIMGNTAVQVLIVGDPGCGKSTVCKFYSFTLTDKSAFRDATAVTQAGLLGSSEIVDIMGSRSPVMQLGLLERYEIAVLDEFLDKSNEELNGLKNALSSSTITSEKHNNKREVLRNAIILAPSNVPDSHMKKIKFLMQNVLGDIGDMSFNIRVMPKRLKEYFTSIYVNWRDGESYPFLDRFPFIFYIESKKRDIGVIGDIVKGSEDKIPDNSLRALLFTKSIDDYMRECAKIRFIYNDDFDTPGLDRIIKKYCLPRGSFSEGFGDDIHSLERLNKFLKMMIECHAMINFRDHSIEEDYVWLDKFYSKTCNFVYTDELFWDDVKKDEVVVSDSKRGELRFHILDYLGRCITTGATRDVILGSCSMFGFDTEVAVSVLNEMVSDNIIVFNPPNIYKVMQDSKDV